MQRDSPLPRASLGRYLIVKVVLFAAVANVVINAVAGRAFYRADHAVLLFGDPSVAGDTLASAFLIGFFTFLGAIPSARREARRGLVRGLGRQRAWLAWIGRHPFLGAIAFAAFCTLIFGAPAVLVLAKSGITEIARDAFLMFKVSFAGVVGVIAAVMAALIGIAAEPDVSDDPRWCPDPLLPPGSFSYPCDYIDKGGIAVTDRERGCSGTPTWHLMVRGALDPAHVRSALGDVIARYPSLTTKVQSIDAVPPQATRFRYAHDRSFRVEDIFEVVDHRGNPGALETLAADLQNRHLDLFTDFPMTLTMAITGDDTCRLFFRQHHAIADGRAFIALLADFAAFLEAAREGRRPSSAALAPIGRKSELAALGLGRLRRLRFALTGYRLLAGAVVRALRTPVVALRQNQSNDYTGQNGTVHWVLDDTILETWNASRKRLDVSLNSLLTAALVIANARWHQSAKLPLGRTIVALLMETRPRDGAFVSFANHLATIEVELHLDREHEFAAICRSIQEEARRQRDLGTPIKRLLCERQLASLMTLEQIKTFVFESKVPTHSLNFSNLIPLDFPPIGGRGWAVEQVLITTPVAPRLGIALTVIRYGGQVFFNFNYKSSAATREETEELCRHFKEVLEEACDQPSPSRLIDAGGAA